MAKFEAVHHIKHNGKECAPGDGIDIDPKKDKQLIESGAVKEPPPIRVSSKEKSR